MIWQEIQIDLEGDFARGYALAKHLGCTESMDRNTIKGKSYTWGGTEVDDYGYDDGDFSGHRVLTDEEADELAYKQTKPNPNQHPLHEFVDSAVGHDGRGHYINRYDGNEYEVKVGRKTFYIYRVD